ncbi:hypothetical protein GCM10010266_04750 [Streptomyces griseomycini]|uniref:hypothetical protein n=1 Tax=Streptomyces griseomycini TaxID=66895 RepID=UPI0018738C9D|nr:hypothetical protein [Streptomyces griseomycini]GGP85522.1 hypothetical protein GCM10010266_04750 [Streptomyces griseomycini]
MGRTDADALVDRARDALHAGGEEADVCAGLARDTGDPRAAALATCLALGVPRAEAERRLATQEAAAAFAELGPGDEEALALVLQAGGAFVVDRRLDAHEQRIRDLLGAAVTAYGAGLPSGLAVSLWRWLRAGELARAYLQLARREARADGSPSAYWAALVTAGELLPDGDGIDEAREHCRRMAKRCPAAP